MKEEEEEGLNAIVWVHVSRTVTPQPPRVVSSTINCESTTRNYCNHRRNILATKRVVLAGINIFILCFAHAQRYRVYKLPLLSRCIASVALRDAGTSGGSPVDPWC